MRPKRQAALRSIRGPKARREGKGRMRHHVERGQEILFPALFSVTLLAKSHSSKEEAVKETVAIIFFLPPVAPHPSSLASVRAEGQDKVQLRVQRAT